ncbi:DUF4102 domain-containing protein [Salmonella enterica subsp. enterica]|nr:DUF4102 domain-containing protein [Salmonella enterica subsp. enterica serovar Nagoya]EED4103619.1 DUF4102 domain-containing protein [Salmonella enterica subsp. enterica serovar Nagoya]
MHILSWSVHIACRYKIKKGSCKKRDQIKVISDAHGLNVRLSTSGSITFFYRYRWNGNAAQLTIGDYPTISLSHARERRQYFRSWLTEGLDPRRQIFDDNPLIYPKVIELSL